MRRGFARSVRPNLRLVEIKILNFYATARAINRQPDRVDRWRGQLTTSGGGFWPFVFDPATTSNCRNAATILTFYGFRYHDAPRLSDGPTCCEPQDESATDVPEPLTQAAGRRQTPIQHHFSSSWIGKTRQSAAVPPRMETAAHRAGTSVRAGSIRGRRSL